VVPKGAVRARRPGQGAPWITSVAYEPLPIESTRPRVELDAPTPVRARAAVRELADESGLTDQARDGLVGAVSEIVTNALAYGRPPVHLAAWPDGGRVVVAVTDCGEGPTEQLRLDAPPARPQGEGGFGLWIARQSCREVTMGRHDGGFTVRLVSS
jgi:anti-sigma regulatory factor (Ser/Thr protein kinase)